MNVFTFLLFKEKERKKERETFGCIILISAFINGFIVPGTCLFVSMLRFLNDLCCANYTLSQFSVHVIHVCFNLYTSTYRWAI